MDPKRKIIDMLNQAGGVVSGETLSAELGISRVSVWKHIKGLVQSGIPVVSSSKGYRLPRDPDSPASMGIRCMAGPHPLFCGNHLHHG
jgi:BirA family biotin operon repressor/biotin-[acetyl-CoA-carboxylase] ligase